MKELAENVTVNMMVKNEIKYIRQSVCAIAPFVKEMIIWDTGSTDGTLEVIDELKTRFPNILSFQSVVDGNSIVWDGNHLSHALTDIRNSLLGMVKTEWCMQVDGDEIYTHKSLMEVDKTLKMIRDHNLSWVKGVMVKIKWCVSEGEYVNPGPFDRTLRLFRPVGTWIGAFPDEFLYIDGRPVTIADTRCVSANTTFLHMSMLLHPERRPVNGITFELTEEEKRVLCNS